MLKGVSAIAEKCVQQLVVHAGAQNTRACTYVTCNRCKYISLRIRCPRLRQCGDGLIVDDINEA